MYCIHTHTLRHEHNRTRLRTLIHNKLLSVSRLDKNSSYAKTHTLCENTHTHNIRHETPQHLVWKTSVIVPAYARVFNAHKTHSQSPLVTYYTHTNFIAHTVHSQSALTNQHAINYTHILYSLCPFLLAGSNWLLSLDANTVGKGQM